jgi:DNA-binding XRE family transcriptional regulator
MRAGNVIYLRPRAASATKTSAPRPPPRAVSVSKIFAQNSAGTLSRCRHLEAVEGFTLISSAKALTEGQRPITSRKELKERISCLLREFVIKSKSLLSLDPNLSRDSQDDLSHSLAMTDYLDEFTQRVLSARVAAQLSQEQIAHVLQVPQPTYSKYEGRSLMPHRYMWTFCLTCGVSVEWLVTGQGPGVPLVHKGPKRMRRNTTRRRVAA